MAFMKHKVSVTMKLPQLQNLIKRDPASYKEEFLMQKQHFDSELDIFKLRPTKESDRFTELVTFMSHVSNCYPDVCGELPNQLMELLETHASVLHPDVRANLIQSLILMRNKNMIGPVALLKLSFKLFTINDKALRTTVGDYIFNDIKSNNANKHNEKLNKSIQTLLFNVVAEDTATTARKTVEILSELYRKRIWTDARTVNVLGTACLSESTRVCVSAISFFLGIETKMMEDDEEEKVTKENKVTTVNYHEHSKKTRKRQRDVKKAIERKAKLQKELADKENNGMHAVPLFPAIQLLNDPNALAEKLFKKLRQTNERFEVKLLIMNFISRLIGCHKLLMLSFYSFLQKYLTSHQQNVTQILAYLIQGCHDLVPPEDLMPVVKAIAHNFVTERCSNEVLTVGINGIREILARVPTLLREPDMGDFIQDLALYAHKTHKSVMMAARGVINLVREQYPALLKRGDRGKNHNINQQPNEYGRQRVSTGVDGVELLEEFEKGNIILNEDDEVVWKEDIGSDDNDEEEEEEEEVGSDEGSGEWEDVDDDDEEEGGEEVGDENEESGEWEDVDDEEEEEEEGEGADDGSEEDDEEEEEVEMDEEGGSEEEEEDEMEQEQQVAAEKAGSKGLSKAALGRKLDNIRNRADASRVLSNEDFAMIARLKVAAAQRMLNPKHKHNDPVTGKRTREEAGHVEEEDGSEDEEDNQATGPMQEYAVDPDSLAPSVRIRKTTKIERMTNVLEGRKDVRFEKEKHGGGLTNKEKLRKKNYVMVRKGKRNVANKMRRSAADVRYLKNTKKEVYGRDKRKQRRI